MSEQLKAVIAAIVIVSCIALLGFLVHEKVDGAAVLAVSTVAVLVAYFTRPPEKKDPPAMHGVLAVAAAGILATVISGCAAFRNAEPYLPSAEDVACVYNEVKNGDVDPMTIIGKCPSIPLDAVVIVEHLVEGNKRGERMYLAAHAKDGGAK